LPRGKLLPHSGLITLKILPPFYCDASASVEADLARLHAAMSAVFESGA